MTCYDLLTFVTTFPIGSGIGRLDLDGVDLLHSDSRFLPAVGENPKKLERR